jgi:CubicO group peptidase (beta-lactamase class C family)
MNKEREWYAANVSKVTMRLRTWAAALAGLMVAAFVHAAHIRAGEGDLQNKIDALLSSVTKHDAPGLAVVVKQHGRIVLAQGYGVRELRNSAKIDADTNFRLASVTKQFTAMAAMLLVHDKKLNYEQRLTDIFPDFPEYGRNITVRNLLNHTSGLPDYEDLMEKDEKSHGPRWSAERQIQDAEVLALLEKAPSGKFAPGTSWAYSNSGYVVLGLIVAKVSGEPYGDFLAQRIFAPLHMTHSLVYVKNKNEIPSRAYGHSLEHGQLRETDQNSTSATLGDGGVYSNVNDMVKWDEGLEKHTLLTEKEMQPALTPVKLANGSEPHWPEQPDDDNLAPGKPVAYGFGWFLNPYEGRTRMWHSGSTMGFRTVIQRFPKDDVSLVILCNRTDLNPQSLAERIATLALQPIAH